MPGRPLTESAILRPRDTANTDSDSWPVFELVDVLVTDPDDESQAPTNLLHASAHHPLTVTGRLRPLAKQLSHLLVAPTHRSSPIQLNDVRSYSYGAYEDGSIGVWACGKAGWFQISPSKTYQPMYDGMTEAVKMLHYIADTYATPRMSGKVRISTPSPAPTMTELLRQPGFQEAVGAPTVIAAAEKMYAHRLFLLMSMIAGKEGLVWTYNPLYIHLRAKFPGDGLQARKMLFGGEGRRGGATQDSVVRGRAPSLDASSTSSLKRKRGRPSNERPIDVVSVASSSVASSGAKARDMKPTSNRPLASRGTRTRSVLRQLGTPEAQHSPQTAEDEDSDTDSMPHPRKGKSALRLKPNVSSKGPPLRSKTMVEESDDGAEEEPGISSLSINRRKSSDIRYSRPLAEVDEGISMPTSPSTTSQTADLDPDAVLGAAQELNHTPDPVQEDTWVCALAGCTHKVYAASQPSSQILIRQHYALHACDDDERVQMVKRLQAPSLPTGRLVEKVKLQAKLEGFPGSRGGMGTRYPEPLRRIL